MKLGITGLRKAFSRSCSLTLRVHRTLARESRNVVGVAVKVRVMHLGPSHSGRLTYSIALYRHARPCLLCWTGFLSICCAAAMLALAGFDDDMKRMSKKSESTARKIARNAVFLSSISIIALPFGRLPACFAQPGFFPASRASFLWLLSLLELLEKPCLCRHLAPENDLAVYYDGRC